MGNGSFETEKADDSIAVINKNNFMYHYVIGRGGFGKVWKVQKK